MKYLLPLALAFVSTDAASIASCSDQSECLSISGDDDACDGEGKRTVCMKWNNEGGSCGKDVSDSVSHACPVVDGVLNDDSNVKTEDWASDSQICVTVVGGENAVFGVKDGSKCSDEGDYSIFSGETGTCSGPLKACEGGNKKECSWSFPTSACSSGDDTAPTDDAGSGDDSSSCVDDYASCANYAAIGYCPSYFCPTCSYAGYCDLTCDYCDEGDDGAGDDAGGDDGGAGTNDDAGGDDGGSGTNGGGGHTCFSGDDKVQLESGDMKHFRDVKVGDSILSANRDGVTSYSNVIFLPHGENDQRANFVEINTVSGKVIKMTRGHLIPLCSGDLKTAAAIEKGACLRTIHGEDEVLNATDVILNGVYTAVTENEFVVVNGIIASPFAASSGLVHAYYNRTDMENWCESNDWLAFESIRHPHVKQMVKPSDDCLTMLNEMFENFKDEPIGWGKDGFGYRNNWLNPATPEIEEKTERTIPFILSGWD
jgi:hypothetical protein